MKTEALHHCKVNIKGIVQGVGFRPFVYRLANAHGLSGSVLNDPQGVTIHLYGLASAVESCIAAIIANPPPLARIDSYTVEELDDEAVFNGFHIIKSQQTCRASVALSPDMATCPDCLADIANPHSRYYRYPFTNCTNCGPRYSIICSLPYDRKATSMAGFDMCPACRQAYSDPNDRRYHAQPISCPQCGPQLRYLTADGCQQSQAESALSDAISAILRGEIIAVKGLGGFQLVCDATNSLAVQQLRLRKQRPLKPLAVMVKDEAMAQSVVVGCEAEWQQLRSAQRPIVLMQKRDNPTLVLADELTFDIESLGLFLPYTPLHALLLDGVDCPIVATSANISGDPILTDCQAVIRQLGLVVDGILDHNRAIIHPCDDSVVQVINDKVMVLRLARGFAPLSFALHEPVSRATFAAGAQQKNSLALAFDKQVIVSPYIGDLHSFASEEHYQQTLTSLTQCYQFMPQVVVHDLHPNYASTQIAMGLGGKPIALQHHYAHILSQLAINQSNGPVLGFAFDGTGLGDDGKVWGGEVMLADIHDYQQLASFKPFMLIGADNAVKDTNRLLLALLFERYSPDDILAMNLTALADCEPSLIRNLHRLWTSKASCIATSSTGRLFDAVARLLGLIDRTQFEGEAGMKIAQHASYLLDSDDHTDLTLPFALAMVAVTTESLALQWDTHALFAQILDAVIAKPLTSQRIAAIAGGFIGALADAVCAFAVQQREQKGINTVTLCGGVFQNKVLYALCEQHLISQGFQLLSHQQLPINDASIALGQLWYGIHNGS
ncbi:carbamoyltransferase HypF [Photobacterium nomapromontoriensis]|uniref:carbamoyltransferase HypF n=1 Tax=Photobacterium nomapromontoriensis TaxID=2910237 RepID=UPI003D0A4E14